MITLIIPYYRAQAMLLRQLEEICCYPWDLEVVIVDDGSPEPAEGVIANLPRGLMKTMNIPKRVRLFRILEDIPWNREQARNLGAYVAETEWIIQVDIDHILPVTAARELMKMAKRRELNLANWYRFPRKRIGKADFTRRKDAIPDDQQEGWIKPHMDSYLISRTPFLRSPYDERYAGMLGGGTPFNERMKRVFGDPQTLPKDVWLEVHTTDSVKDASITTLSRDKSAYSEMRMKIGQDDKPLTILHHPWEQVQI